MRIKNLEKSAKLAFAGLSANRMRTGLSVLGIVIGVAAVIAIVSMGQGLKALIMGQLNAFGSDVMSVEVKIPGSDYGNSARSIAQGVLVTTLKESDAEALRDKDRFPYIDSVSAYSSGMEIVSYGGVDKQPMIIAADAYYSAIDPMSAAEKGRFFTREEDESVQQVVLLGKDIATEFFAEDDPIGKTVKIGSKNFRVVGVLKERGEMMSFNMDEMVIVPLSASQKLLRGVDYVQEIGIRLKDKRYLPQAKAEVASLVRVRHGIDDPKNDDFEIFTMDEAMKTVNSITTAISVLLGLLAAISLFVGGIGIMNIMLVIVAERTREIGLRKAVGARYRDIMRQFVLEAVAISLIGGFLGVALGIGFSWVAAWAIVNYVHLEWPFVVSYEAIGASFAVATAFGIVFGWYPAKEAAKLSPIEAIRK